jgi:hypothetical protein
MEQEPVLPPHAGRRRRARMDSPLGQHAREDAGETARRVPPCGPADPAGAATVHATIMALNVAELAVSPWALLEGMVLQYLSAIVFRRSAAATAADTHPRRDRDRIAAPLSLGAVGGCGSIKR